MALLMLTSFYPTGKFIHIQSIIGLTEKLANYIISEVSLKFKNTYKIIFNLFYLLPFTCYTFVTIP